jgi:hypothetical protein
VFLGEGDADLHRSAGANRVEAAKQRLAARQFRDHVLVQRVHLLLGTQRVDARLVAAPIGRRLEQGQVENTFGRPYFSRRWSICCQTMRASRATGSDWKLDSCSMTAIAAQMFSGSDGMLQGRDRRQDIRRPAAAVSDPRR